MSILKPNWQVYVTGNDHPIPSELFFKHLKFLEPIQTDPIQYLFTSHPLLKHYPNAPLGRWLYQQVFEKPLQTDTFVYLLDVVHWHIGMNTITSLEPIDIDKESARLAFKQVQNLFPNGWQLHFHRPNRWFLTTGRPLVVEQPTLFSGQPVFNTPCQSDDQKQWQRLLTEIQMCFNELFAQTQTSGLVPNSLHLWGGGDQTPVTDNQRKPSHTGVYSNDELISAVATQLDYTLVDSIQENKKQILMMLNQDEFFELISPFPKQINCLYVYHRGYSMQLKNRVHFAEIRHWFLVHHIERYLNR